MKTIEYRWSETQSNPNPMKNKSRWGKGEWENEPDKKQWQDEQTASPCLIVRNSMGSWCGYVGVLEGHPCFEMDYDSAYEFLDEGVHGGLTYAGFCQDHGTEEDNVCHIPEDGEEDRVWWLGFDCAHAWDVSPGSRAFLSEVMPNPAFTRDEVYRDQKFVEGEVGSLARQLERTEHAARAKHKNSCDGTN